MRRKTTSMFIDEAKSIHGEKYNYDNVIYNGDSNKVAILCYTHGLFMQTPNKHLAGQGCMQCFRIRRADSDRIGNDEFINRSRKIHGNRYDYSLVKYNRNDIKVEIICTIHGIFLQIPNDHIRGHGCDKCSGTYLKSVDEFISQSRSVHNNLYAYDNVNYINNITKVAITCLTHGDYLQTPHNHLSGVGCPRCFGNISKLESKWLDSLNVVDRQSRILIKDKFYKVDGFDATTNTVYEFYGDYWHGNPKIYNADDINTVVGNSFGNLYAKTLEKESILKANGYKIISIWENDFLNCNE